MRGEAVDCSSPQIGREILQFRERHAPLGPAAVICCERIAYIGDDDVRFTFDYSLRWRTNDLDISLGSHGAALLDRPMVVMEIKFPDAAPLWLSHLLNGRRLYPVSFSKYGTCFMRFILPEWYASLRAGRT